MWNCCRCDRWQENRTGTATGESRSRGADGGATSTRGTTEDFRHTQVPAAVAMLDRDMRYLQVSDRFCADYSLDSSEILGRSHYEVFPDLPERWKEIHRRCLAGETLRAEEDRWDREDGTTWLRWDIRPWQNLDGVQGGILIFSEDITHRKQAEEALLGMSLNLIDAHEQERSRIGRELHDDIVQRLALLAVQLDRIQQEISRLDT